MTAKELLRERVESLSESEAITWLAHVQDMPEHEGGRPLTIEEIARLPVDERWRLVRPETWEVDMEEFAEWDALSADGLDHIDD